MPEDFENQDSPDLDLPPSFLNWAESPIEAFSSSLTDLVEVSIQELAKETTLYGEAFRVVLTDGMRHMSILVGPFESQAILHVLRQEIPDRPMTHDLTRNLVARLGGAVKRVIIDDLMNTTYYAKLYIETREGEIEMDSRPSDAIALALRFDAPIFVTEGILVTADE